MTKAKMKQTDYYEFIGVINEVLCCLGMSEEFETSLTNYPLYIEADKRLRRAIDAVADRISEDEKAELEDAGGSLCMAYMDVGILFGMRAGMSLRDVLADPALIGEYILRMRRHRDE